VIRAAVVEEPMLVMHPCRATRLSYRGSLAASFPHFLVFPDPGLNSRARSQAEERARLFCLLKFADIHW
jgi:hypothetical protein